MLQCRLSEQDSKPPHLAAISTPGDGCPHPCMPSGGIRSTHATPSTHLGHEPIKLAPLGRVRSGGLLGGNLPGSAAAAAVVNLYSGPSGVSLLWVLSQTC